MSEWAHTFLSRVALAFPTKFAEEGVVAVVLGYLAYLLYCKASARLSQTGGTVLIEGRWVAVCIAGAMLLPVALRLALLPWLPTPLPRIHDDFSQLLAVDTLMSGRLSNQAHPLWHHLETIFVLQQPTYASIYPLGQGLIMAIGRAFFGSPWAGVLLATALMCGAITWMLFGCLPPNWAAVGGTLVAVNYGLAKTWIDTYHGGAFCAFGGALLFGALCRISRTPSKTMGLVAGLGWSIICLIRPFECVLAFAASWAIIAALVIRDLKIWRRWVGPVVVLAGMEISAGVVTLAHNQAVTGSFTTSPYQLSQRLYGVPQSFVWQAPIEEPALRFRELSDMYLFQRNIKDRATSHPLRRLKIAFSAMWNFYVTPWYSLPIVLALILKRDRNVWIAGGLVGCALALSVLYPFFRTHYVAASTCLIAFLIVQGMIVLSQWSFRGRAVGSVLVIFLLSGGVVTGLRIVPVRSMLGLPGKPEWTSDRARVARLLMGIAGQHVVFVRYVGSHTMHDEWVYNAADVDRARIVWCRAMGPGDDVEVARYYKDRQKWLVNVGGEGVEAQLSPYEPEVPLAGAVTAGSVRP